MHAGTHTHMFKHTDYGSHIGSYWIGFYHDSDGKNEADDDDCDYDYYAAIWLVEHEV